MKKNIKHINNTNGFTLVELLAVIVVLAIVMVIAVNAVMPTLQDSRKNTFAIEVNGAIEAAQTYYMNGGATGDPNRVFPTSVSTTRCVTIKQLVDAGLSELDPTLYSGLVSVKKKSESSNIYLYKVWLHHATLMVTDKGSSTDYNKDVVGNDAVDYVKATFDSSLPTGCSFGTGDSLDNAKLAQTT